MERYYTAVMILCMYILAVMEVFVAVSGNLTPDKKRQFAILFAVTALAFACEYTGNLLQGADTRLRLLHILVKALELSTAPFIGLIIARILCKPKYQRIIAAFFLLHAAAIWLSGKLGFVYYVDADNFYHHAQFYGIYIFTYMVSVLYALVFMFRTMRRYQYNGAVLMGLAGGLIILGVGIQLVDSSVKLAWLAVTMTGMLLFIFDSEMVQQTDALTMLINRRGYEVTLSHLQQQAVVSFFDVDRFKEVNDTYGHLYGDYCLKAIGACLQETYSRSGKCFRIGGDEFCVILTKNAGQIEQLNSQFFAKLEKIRTNEENEFPFVSVGYVLYDPENNNAEDAIKVADEMMYRYKKEHRGRGEA